MRKRWIIPLFILWILAAGQLVWGHQNEAERVTEVFAHVGTEEQTSVVEYYGVYKKDFLELDEREVFLRKIASQFGISDDITITRTYDEDKEETKLSKEASKADTVLRFITSKQDSETSQYMIMNITMKSGMQDALAYRKKMENLLKPYGKNSRSSANIIGSYEGKLTLTERNKIADKLLKEMGAKIVSENRDMKLYTIYGYMPWLGEYEMQENHPVNINIAMYYSGTRNKTYVYAAVPIVGLDY